MKVCKLKQTILAFIWNYRGKKRKESNFQLYQLKKRNTCGSRGAQEGISGFTRARQINIKGDTLHPVEYLHHI